MAYKLLDSAQRGWMKLDCAIMLLWIHKGIKCKDGQPVVQLGAATATPAPSHRPTGGPRSNYPVSLTERHLPNLGSTRFDSISHSVWIPVVP